MNKKAIKTFAIGARRKLIDEVTIKAKRLGINESGIENAKQIDSNLQEIVSSGMRIQGKEIGQRNKLIDELTQRASVSSHSEAFQELIEEVAYTWFNRLIAIRFMEVNDYLPDTYRVLSSETNGKIEPDIITDLYDSDIYEEFSSNEQQQVQAWKSDNSAEAMDSLYQLVFIKICNQLNTYLPELFEKVEDYTELLFTASYIKKDGVIADLLQVPEDDFNVQNGGQVEIIGWLYQYYNSEPHNQVVNIYKGIVKKQDIPAATQLFTTDWVVRYMVDNSVGKYWLDHYPDSELKNKLEYLVPDKNVNELASTKSSLKPEELKVMDNAMGSGHILVYAFDVLMEIYRTLGYSERDAARAIVEYNLYGLEIDKRAYQLAYFAVMMKGRQHDRLFLKKKISPNLREFIDAPKVNEEYDKRITELNEDRNSEKWNEYQELIFDEFSNGKELGSIIRLIDSDKQLITKEYLAEVRQYILKFEQFTDMDILYGLKETQEKYLHILDLAGMMIEKYTAVVTNPPYLNKMDKKLKKYVNNNYTDVKKDLFSVFIQLNSQMLIEKGYASFMTPFVWMFISSYEKLRSFLINERNISSLIQMEYSAFEEATVPICTFTIKNSKEQSGSYIKLSEFAGGMEIQRLKTLDAINNNQTCGYFFNSSQENFKKIPGMPIAYWASEDYIKNYMDSDIIGNKYAVKSGIMANVEKFTRYWFEVNNKNIGLSIKSVHEMKSLKWFQLNSGAKNGVKKYYGNNEKIINLWNDGFDIRSSGLNYRLRDKKYYFKQGITWGRIGSSGISFRKVKEGTLFGDAGPVIFVDENVNYLLGLLNSTIFKYGSEVINPTLNFQVSDIQSFPVKFPVEKKDLVEIEQMVNEMVDIFISDERDHEQFIDFGGLPKIQVSENKLNYFVDDWIVIQKKRNMRIEKLQIQIDTFFEQLYGVYLEQNFSNLEGYILKVESRNEIIKKVISYSVGIIFGRYSLDEEGLIYAGGEWDPSRYQKFRPDADNVLLITDDEFFKDGQYDIVNRFIDFVEITFGKETLEENLQFIADTLGGKGTSREIIRRYFVKDFYKDHLKTYSNRPIYWQLDSGKQNGFKALMYLHRYTPDQLGKVRTDYLHELQKAYDNRIELRQQQISTSDNQKEINLMTKEIAKIQKQLKEVREYDEKLGHLALKRIELDLDNGVIVNYDKLQRDPETGEKFAILSKGVQEPKK
ncbi:BREX-1 system adenine-specific DNA-methyltransferase PglX [Enterococcus casseliflavus]|uniref:site-specific DNA-methyltransferase (adenine-specific) n=1 Tax=Enterococcus casseliflavus TaxID=37734 RepID=A0A6G2FLY6_ENTCA|nr:BREX-1 system adenine-specific DNA-methyltransferase PglX [Enterococcus casseliflavus]MUN75449.1 BREX-1 system adenine-specific DNA-methyltransferase PglX [Enterococcus casseliflavus]